MTYDSIEFRIGHVYQNDEPIQTVLTFSGFGVGVAPGGVFLPYDPELVAMIRDVADAEVARVRGEGASWRIALERVSLGEHDILAEIAADALEPDSPAAAASPEPRVSLTRAGEDCERYRRVVENLVAWDENAVTRYDPQHSLRGILDDARAALEAK